MIVITDLKKNIFLKIARTQEKQHIVSHTDDKRWKSSSSVLIFLNVYCIILCQYSDNYLGQRLPKLKYGLGR